MNEKYIEAISSRKKAASSGEDRIVRGIHFRRKPTGDPSGDITVDWVDFRSNAFIARLRPGDVIESANLKPVRSVRELHAIVENATDGTLLLLVRRRNERRYIAIDCREKADGRTQFPLRD